MATSPCLDRLKAHEQFVRRKRRLDRDHLIEVPRLLETAQRFGFLDAGLADDSGCRQFSECPTRRGEVLMSITQVRA